MMKNKKIIYYILGIIIVIALATGAALIYEANQPATVQDLQRRIDKHESIKNQKYRVKVLGVQSEANAIWTLKIGDDTYLVTTSNPRVKKGDSIDIKTLQNRDVFGSTLISFDKEK